ncbi:MAG TPA: response regulator [Deltaproteobacteria bacterium]|nr:response regulator [Deltaproteobacteria bacterium]
MQEAIPLGREQRKKKRMPAQPLKKKILIVDDEESVGIGMTEILKDAGFMAKYVTDGMKAVEEVAKEHYDLVFMDIVMPEVNGLEAFRRIKQIKKNVRVVLFTGFYKDAEKIIFEGIKEGMIEEFLRKPFFAEEIINIARKYA